MGEVTFGSGEAIFRQGDPSEQCYRILSGKVEIRLAIPGLMSRSRSQAIATCGPGELIGEMSVIDAAPRSASAVAIEPTRCQVYDATAILGILQNDPDEALAYVRTLIRRIRNSNKKTVSAGTHLT